MCVCVCVCVYVFKHCEHCVETDYRVLHWHPRAVKTNAPWSLASHLPVQCYTSVDTTAASPNERFAGETLETAARYSNWHFERAARHLK